MNKPYILFNLLLLFCLQAAAQQSRIIAESQYNSSGKFVDSADYTYSFGRGGHPDVPILYDQKTMYKASGSSHINNYRYIYTYDYKSAATTYEYKTWDAGSNAWIDNNRLNFNTGSPRTDTNWRWDIANQKWYANVLNIIQTNATGKVTLQTNLTWSVANQKFDSTAQYKRSYDAAGNMTEEIILTYNGSHLDNHTKHVWTYNSANDRTSFTSYKWDATNKVWTEDTKNVYLFSGKITQSFSFKWNTGTALWDSTARRSYTYDGNGNNTKLLVQTYSTANATWSNSTEHTYTYNTFGQKTLYIYRTWNTSNNTWSLLASYYYYYETYDPAGVSDMDYTTTEMKVWPVPASGLLHVAPVWQQAEGYTGMITDITGRTVAQWASPASTASAVQQVDISALTTGMYNIRLVCNNGEVQHATFNVVK